MSRALSRRAHRDMPVWALKTRATRDPSANQRTQACQRAAMAKGAQSISAALEEFTSTSGTPAEALTTFRAFLDKHGCVSVGTCGSITSLVFASGYDSDPHCG